MTLNDYLLDNPGKASYTIRVCNKSYLCNFSEASKLFGQFEVKAVTYRGGNEMLPLIKL